MPKINAKRQYLCPGDGLGKGGATCGHPVDDHGITGCGWSTAGGCYCPCPHQGASKAMRAAVTQDKTGALGEYLTPTELPLLESKLSALSHGDLAKVAAQAIAAITGAWEE